MQQRIVHGRCTTTQCVGGSLQTHRVPEHDGRRDKVQATGAVALLLETTVPDFPKPVKEHRPGQRVARQAQIRLASQGLAPLNGRPLDFVCDTCGRVRPLKNPRLREALPARADFEVDRQLGRKPKMTESKIESARKLLASGAAQRYSQ